MTFCFLVDSYNLNSLYKSSNLCINMHSLSSLFLCSNSRTAKTIILSLGHKYQEGHTRSAYPKCLKPGVDVAVKEKWVPKIWIFRITSVQTLVKWGLVSLPQALSWASGTRSVTEHTPATLCKTVSGLDAFTKSAPRFPVKHVKLSMIVSEVTLLVNGRMYFNRGLDDTKEEDKDRVQQRFCLTWCLSHNGEE